MHVRFLTLLSLLLPAVLATPAPNDHKNDHHEDDCCLTQKEFVTLRDRWIKLFSAFNANDAKAILAPDFTLYSESTNSLTPGKTAHTVHDPVFTSLAQIIASNDAQGPPSTSTFSVIASDHGCYSFTFRWSLDIGTHVPDNFIAGIDFVYIDKKTRKINKAYSEFNTFGLVLVTGSLPGVCQSIPGSCAAKN